ncbi:MAG: TrkA family potassium uptake protein [Anaerolineales bacterium]|jgi:trk system potassium uptake protein TrkA
MFVIVAGGGRTGSQLAQVLLSGGHQVIVVEHRQEMLTRLHQELPTEAIYEGNVSDPTVLEQAGIRNANVIATCTSDDTVNLTLCFLARKMFNVPRTIARVNNPRNAWLFDENFHVDVALNQATVFASLIQEEMSLGDMMTLLKLRRGRYSLVEEKIPPGAKAIGVALKDLGLPDECVIAAIIRNGKITLPRGDTTFQKDDEVLAVTDPEAARQLAELLAPTRD